MTAEERIQKALARQGVASRRQIEKLIAEGKIRVHGKPISLGFKVKGGEVVDVDGQRVTLPKSQTEPTQVILYHKPEGEICSQTDNFERETVFSALPPLEQGRWISVGRLDLNTSGLLLFTNDGELANKLMHPSSNIEREYAVRVFGEVTDEMLSELTQGVQLDDGPAKFKKITPGQGKGLNRWYTVILTEGRKREVRRLWESQGLRVSRLMRTRYGKIKLPRSLKPGQFIYLKESEVKSLIA